MKSWMTAALMALLLTGCSSGGGGEVDTGDDGPSSRGEWRRAILAEGIDWESQGSGPDWSIDAYQDVYAEACDMDGLDEFVVSMASSGQLDEVRFNFTHACPDQVPVLEQTIDDQLCQMTRSMLDETLGEQYDTECV